MQLLPTAIPEVLLLEPRVFHDARGYFLESYNRRTLAPLGVTCDFVQDSASFSHRGTLRGLHFQKAPHAQAKLVRVVAGKILDVALDIRAGSPTFGQAVVTELTGENNRALFIPWGFAHGFVALTDAHVAYKTDGYYAPESDGAVNALDADLEIDWQVPACALIVSPKDAAARSWQAYCDDPAFVFEGAAS